jgi:hypothetical protein
MVASEALFNQTMESFKALASNERAEISLFQNESSSSATFSPALASSSSLSNKAYHASRAHMAPPEVPLKATTS